MSKPKNMTDEEWRKVQAEQKRKQRAKKAETESPETESPETESPETESPETENVEVEELRKKLAEAETEIKKLKAENKKLNLLYNRWLKAVDPFYKLGLITTYDHGTTARIRIPEDRLDDLRKAGVIVPPLRKV